MANQSLAMRPQSRGASGRNAPWKLSDRSAVWGSQAARGLVPCRTRPAAMPRSTPNGWVRSASETASGSIVQASASAAPLGERQSRATSSTSPRQSPRSRWISSCLAARGSQPLHVQRWGAGGEGGEGVAMPSASRRARTDVSGVALLIPTTSSRSGAAASASRAPLRRCSLAAPSASISQPHPSCCGGIGRHRRPTHPRGRVLPPVLYVDALVALRRGRPRRPAVAVTECSCRFRCSWLTGGISHRLPLSFRSIR